MAIRKLTLRTTHAQKGMRLDQVLSDWLPEALAQPVSKAKARKLIVAGAVYLNGKRVRIASKELQAGAQVDAYVDLARLLENATAADRPFQMTASHILYEDEWLLAVNKPAGLPTQPTLDEARANLFAAVKKFIGPGGYVGLHHRLDRDTSGVVLFTRDPQANAGVAELFSKHLARKTYQALALGAPRPPGQEWTVRNYLARARGTGKQSRFESVRSGGDSAHTDFRILAQAGRALYLEARPLTGRTHQIRVHLAEAGMPILGDATYGSRESRELSSQARVPRLMLHAVNLTFPHPISNVEISVSSPLPEDFTQCLARLRE
jgi:RluA family pseudouridine synthase